MRKNGEKRGKKSSETRLRQSLLNSHGSEGQYKTVQQRIPKRRSKAVE